MGRVQTRRRAMGMFQLLSKRLKGGAISGSSKRSQHGLLNPQDCRPNPDFRTWILQKLLTRAVQRTMLRIGFQAVAAVSCCILMAGDLGNNSAVSKKAFFGTGYKWFI